LNTNKIKKYALRKLQLYPEDEKKDIKHYLLAGCTA
jgi:hypothetical protein